MKNRSLATAAILVMATACQNNVLGLVPLNDIPAETVFAEPDLVEAFVNETYGRGVRHGFWRQGDVVVDSLSDDCTHFHWRGTKEFVTGTTTPDNGENATANLWNESYRALRSINVFFFNIDAAPVEFERKQELIAEMRFIRAWVYADLIRWYGGVPIIDEVLATTDTQKFHTTVRASYDEVVARIVAELDQAMPMLPPIENGGKATQMAAMALKSKVLLYAASPLNNPTNDQAKWIAARDAAKAVIDAMPDQTLHPNYAEVFLSTTSETLWARTFAGGGSGRNLMSRTNNRINIANNPGGYGGYGGNNPLQALVDAYDMANGLPITDPNSGYNPQNPYLNRDPRFYATINHNGAMWKERPVETFDGGKDSMGQNATRSGYHLRKYLDEQETPSEIVPSTTPWSFFRKGGVFLNYAETLLALGDEINAQLWMNKTRARVGMPPITETGPLLVERYRQERRVELAFEEHRLFDILRWQIADRVLNEPARGVTITIDAVGGLHYDYEKKKPVPDRAFDATKHYRMPIPRSEIDKAPMILQNPGYN